MERSPKERLYWLLELVHSNKIDFDDFCNEFHITYDHQLDQTELSTIELALFRDLAHTAARFSDFDEDFKKFPGVYSDKDTIISKLKEIRHQLAL